MSLKRLLTQSVKRTNILHYNHIQTRLCASAPKYPTINELFSRSKTCTKLDYRGIKIYLIGDKPSCDLSFNRIEYVLKTLKPSVCLLESENPYLGQDNNQFNQKDASWRRPNPTGTLILESYQNLHADYYPNLAQHLESYTPDNRQSHVLQIRNLCEKSIVPMYYCGDELADTLLKKSKSGQLEELTIQFREQFLREAKKAKERRDKHASVHGKQAQSFFGTMEGLDEKEQREHIELTRLVVEDLKNLTNMFIDDILMNSLEFKSMMNECNNLETIDDYELISTPGLIRNGVLNEIIRSLDFDYKNHSQDFWTALKLLTVNRDRLLLRTLTQQCDDMIIKDEKTNKIILGVFNIIHIWGIENMWRNTEFWKDEQDSKEYVKEMADRDWIVKDLEKKNAPFFGQQDPPRDKDLGDIRM